MALQNEDMFDVLSTIYPHHDIVLLMDSSTGHRKQREDALHAPSMSVKWGGLQPHMHKTTINEVGTHPSILSVGDTQSMVFQRGDKGPFDMKDPLSRKNTKETGKKVRRKKKKQEMILELKTKKFMK